MPNSIPKLLTVVRPSLADVAAWIGVTRALADVWRAGSYQPKPKSRAALVRAVRHHAARLLALADRVESEGQQGAELHALRRRTTTTQTRRGS
jgi:hypothetical protein